MLNAEIFTYNGTFGVVNTNNKIFSYRLQIDVETKL